MRPTLRLLLPILLFVSLFSPNLSAQQSFTNSSACPCTLRGTVLDSVTGHPIHGALVSANVNSAPSMLTDAEGQFQLEGLPGGTITLQATKPGYSSPEMVPRGLPSTIAIELAPGTPLATLNLTPEGVIFGKVTDENGDPLEGLSVGLLRRAPLGRQFFQDPRSRSITDDEGKFRIADLSRGSFYIVVQDPQAPALTNLKNTAVPQGYPPTYFPGVSDLTSAALVKVLPGKSVQANFSLRREPFVRISGTLTGYSQNDQVQLSLESSSGDPLPAEFSFDARTGAFQSKWIAPGSYTLRAQSSPAQSSTPDHSTLSIATQSINASSDLSGIRLTFQSAINIPVEIRGDISYSSAQNTAAPVAVTLIPRDRSIRNEGRSTTLAWLPLTPPVKMTLLLPNVFPGAYSAEFLPTGSFFVESATWGSTDLLNNDLVVSSSSAVPPIEITLRVGGASINGSVSSGDQRTSAGILLFTSSRHRLPEFFYADPTGNFSISGLAPGVYRIIAVDDPATFDYENADVLAKFSSNIQEVTLVAQQTASLHLELARVGD